MKDTIVNVTGGESEEFPTLNLLHVHYDVKEYMGPWYKGACLRHKRNKKILRDITAQFKAGEITALLGNSGSGKTSLLDVLSCRTSGGVSGKVYYNNQEISKKLIRQKAAYVMQADRLLAKLTVREILTYAAYLRLPGNNSKQDIKRKVKKVIHDMGLTAVSDSPVGGLITRGISGGERRRVTIAIQLLQDPKILLLDEPTTGLDCHTARHLISKLAEIAKRGKIVILTIHQPRSDIFRLFDNVGILSLGEMIYFGTSQDLVPYFTALGYPCPQYANPLDHYVDLASIDRRGYEEQHNTMFRVHKLIDEYLDSPILQDLNDKVIHDTLKPVTNRSQFKSPRRAGFFRVFSTILSRLFVNLYRERQNWVFRILVAAAYVAVMVAFLLRLKDDQTSIQDRIGLYWQSVSVASFGSIIIAVPTFPSLRDGFYREYRDGLYSIVTFIAAYIIHLIPVQIMSTLVLSAVGYWAPGLFPDLERYGIYLGVMFVLTYCGEIIAVGIMGAFLNPNIANSVASLFVTASILMSSGFLRNIQTMLTELQWLSYASIHRYASEILVANEFHNLNFTCSASEATPCRYYTGDEYLKDYFPDALDNKKLNLGILASFMAFFTILTILTFKIRGIPNLN